MLECANLKHFENVIIKLVIIHFIILLFAQYLSLTSISPYLTRMIDYEGVVENNYTKILDTINQ